MCLALENWLFLTKNGFLLAMFFPSSKSFQTVHSSSSYIWFPIFACICECVFVCAVYELLAIKYNYTLNPLDFFLFIFSNHTRSTTHHAYSRRGKEKSLIIKLIDFSAFFLFFFLLRDIYLVTRDNFMGYFISPVSLLFSFIRVQRRRHGLVVFSSAR